MSTGSQTEYCSSGFHESMDLSLDPSVSPAYPFPSTPFPSYVAGNEGMFYKGGFLVCGGRSTHGVAESATNKCHHFTLGANMSNDFPTMLHSRSYASSAVYQGRLWITVAKLVTYQ